MSTPPPTNDSPTNALTTEDPNDTGSPEVSMHIEDDEMWTQTTNNTSPIPTPCSPRAHPEPLRPASPDPRTCHLRNWVNTRIHQMKDEIDIICQIRADQTQDDIDRDPAISSHDTTKCTSTCQHTRALEERHLAKIAHFATDSLLSVCNSYVDALRQLTFYLDQRDYTQQKFQTPLHLEHIYTTKKHEETEKPTHTP